MTVKVTTDDYLLVSETALNVWTGYINRDPDMPFEEYIDNIRSVRELLQIFEIDDETENPDAPE